MLEQEIQRKIEDFRVLGLPGYVPRDMEVHLLKNTFSTIIGARRAGKSYRALQVADELVREGTIHSLRNVCPLDFDNPILSEMKAKEIKLIPGVFLKISPEFQLDTPLVFILDEIHKIEGWEEAVIDLSRNPNWRIIVTGSSSRLLRDDIATELRGKSISSIVYPLSFREFLRFKGSGGDFKSTKGQSEIRRHFDEYLKWGGYPAIANLEEGSREALLREYFDTMIMRDIIQRYDVSKPKVCVSLCSYLMSNMSRPATYQSAYQFIKESGFSTSRGMIKDYIDWAKDSWFLFFVDIFSSSHAVFEYTDYCGRHWRRIVHTSLLVAAYSKLSFISILFIELFATFCLIFCQISPSLEWKIPSL